MRGQRHHDLEPGSRSPQPSQETRRIRCSARPKNPVASISSSPSARRTPTERKTARLGHQKSGAGSGYLISGCSSSLMFGLLGEAVILIPEVLASVYFLGIARPPSFILES